MYSLPTIIRLDKSRKIRWLGYVIFMTEMRNMYNTLFHDPDAKGPFRYSGIGFYGL
jgi:hypothetical protein